MSRIAGYVATLMSDHHLENGSIILTAGDGGNNTPYNDGCSNAVYSACRGENESCTNTGNSCSGSKNYATCYNVGDLTNMKPESCKKP